MNIETIKSSTSNIETSEKEFLSDVYYTTIELISENSEEGLLDMCLYHFSKPGKMLRSKLIYKLGQLYQAPAETLLKWAVSCELLHEASLIHDDLQDGDLTRRDQPSVWKKFGLEQAINLGDFLLMLSYLPLSQSSAKSSNEINDFKLLKLIELHCQTAVKLVQGQSSEYGFSKSNTTDPKIKKNQNDENAKSSSSLMIEVYQKCVRGKTGALFSSLAKGVGLITQLKNDELDFLEKTFLEIGVIFQIQDDILDLFGDKKRGFQGSDIQEGKYSVLISKHFDEYPEDISFLKNILDKPRQSTTSEDIHMVKELFLTKGTLVLCLELLEEIIFNLKKLLVKSKATDFNQSLAKHIELMLQHILEPIHNLNVQSSTLNPSNDATELSSN